jgi:MoaA/NifB/PqqE/SkfB family radical SAM enzyme
MHARFLEIEITGACPYRCRHCYGSFPGPGQLSLAEIKRVCAEARGLFDCIIISGGEPFLHPDICAIAEAASRDFLVFITTSGFGITPEHIRRIGNRCVLVFGIDGMGPTHDGYRGMPGAYKTLTHAMKLCRDLPKEIIVTLWKGVIPQIDAIIKLAASYNAIAHFNHLIPVGRVPEHPDIIPDAAELDMLHNKLWGLKKTSGAVITDLHRVTEQDREQGISLFCKGRFNITPTGNVRPCEFHTAVLGTIRNQRLDEIVRKAQSCACIAAREEGFKNNIPAQIENPFDYHTTICHRISCMRQADTAACPKAAL